MGGRKKQGQGDRAAGAEGVEHFRSLLQHHPLPAFVIETGAADPLAYRFLAVNRAAELLYGYTEAEFLEMTLADLRPPEETTISTQQVADLTREGRAAFRTTRAHRHRKKDGSIIHVEVSSQSIPWKELQALLAVVQDVTARVKAEQSLMESEEKYRTLLDSSLTGVFLTQEGVFIYVNDKLAEISGMTREELIGTDAMATVHPDDRPGQRRLMEDLLGGRKSSIRQSFRVLHRSGEARQVEIMASVVWVSGQRAVLGTAIDITERQRAEESLKLFSAAVGEARDGMQLVDLDGRVVYSNKAVERIYGYTHEELRGLDVGKMNADPRFARRHILPALRRDGHWSGQLTVLHKDGHPFPVELSTSMVFGQDGQPVAMVGIIRDITARRAAEQKLEQSEELFRTIFRTSPDAIAINRMRDGVYVRINDGFTAVTGYRVRDVLGKSTSQIGIWSHPEELARLAEKLRKEGKVSGFEATFRLKDGRERTGLLSAHVVSIDGEPHAVSVTRDIEDLKQVEVNLKKALADLEEKNRELEAFVYTAAHDLRTPLISVLGFIELLKRELTGRLEKEQEYMFGRVASNVKHFDNLLRDLLEYSQAGLSDGRRGRIRVGEVVERILEEEGISEMEPPPRVTVEADIPDLCMQETRVYQVFRNLISNSLKFGKDGLPTEIEIGVVAPRAKDLPENHAVLFIRDNGKGIEKRLHSEIFGLFARPGRDHVDGSGVGLAIVKRIVEGEGGRIWLRSAKGKGATFFFSLPVAEEGK